METFVDHIQPSHVPGISRGEVQEILIELQALLQGGLASYHPSVKLVFLALWGQSRIMPQVLGMKIEETCSVAQEVLCRQLGLTRRTVRLALRALQTLRLVEKVVPGTGRCPSVYRVCLPQEAIQIIRQERIRLDPIADGQRDLESTGEKEWRERLSSEDRAILDMLIEGLSESERSEYEREAREQVSDDGVESMVARLVMLRSFGPERLGRYAGWLNA